MAKKRIYLSSPTMHGVELKYMEDAYASNWIAPLGPYVDGLEQDVKDYTGSKNAVALSGGTAAVHLGIKVLNIQEGDIVFCTALTFAASANPVVYEKATPVFIDSEPDTWNMSPVALEKAFKQYPNAKAVICVHLYGTPSKLDEIMAICEKHGVPMIEDAAESLSATYKGKQTGTFGKIGIISFNGNKIITTSGGGMMLSDEKELVEKARFLSTQAREPFRYYQHEEIGYNYRMSNILAAIGRGQMEFLDDHRNKKKWIYETYKEAFKDIPEITMNPLNPDGEANYWLSCIKIDENCSITPDMVIDALEAENIESRRIWKPMQLQPVYRNNDFFAHDEEMVRKGVYGSVSEEIFERGVCLPSDVKNTEEDMQLIIKIVRGLFKK